MVQLLPKYIQRLQETARSLDTLVFRGQSNASWSLRSGATRRLNANGIESGVRAPGRRRPNANGRDGRARPTSNAGAGGTARVMPVLR